MIQIAFFLEERSAKEMLNGLLPRLLPENMHFKCVFFQGKQDLEKQLPIKLRGWRDPNTRFIVLRDQDRDNCVTVKQRLSHICRSAEKPDTLIRIACHELESWYLGDLAAVEAALQLPGIAVQQSKRKFRAPDNLGNASEELKILTKKKYQKIAGSRAIGQFLNCEPGVNRSQSFNTFLSGMQRFLR